MSFPVIKGSAYALIQAPDMVLMQGTTATGERRSNPDSDLLKNLPSHLRSYEDCVAYPPNQAYIGNLDPRELNNIERPWYNHPVAGASEDGKRGGIMSQDLFYGLMKAVDAFDLIFFTEAFRDAVKEKLLAHPVVGKWAVLSKLDKAVLPEEEILALADGHHGEPMYQDGKIVGVVKAAHEYDEALSCHVMFENLVGKASSAYCMQLLLDKSGLKAEDIEYIVECSEEACGDMNQRGGGNFAKSIGEICGCVNATGSDVRTFCAGPAHAMVYASSLVQSGIYKHVVVVAGGCSAKLGMNARNHVEKDMPALEDCLGAFAIHVAENDGVSPVVRTDIVGRHTIGSGASPQAVMQAIVATPLDKAGWSIGDVDCFSPEMQNPEITEPAGAGDVPKANYKMIAALGVMKKVFEKSELNSVVDRIGVPGFAPTQGHIPSGVPFVGPGCEMILNGEIKNFMMIGKGSLFLGRLTNLFDGVSFIVEKNPGLQEEASVDKDTIRQMIAEAMGAFAASLESSAVEE